jgi:hypothetical protein
MSWQELLELFPDLGAAVLILLLFALLIGIARGVLLFWVARRNI